MRRVQDDKPGLVRQTVAEQVQVEGEPATLLERHRHGRPTGEADHGFVDGEAGIGANDFVAALDQRQDGKEKDRFRARGHGPVFRPGANAARPGDILRDRFAQFGEALGRSVMRPALVERPFGGFDNVRRSGEIGFADFQVDDALAPSLQRASPFQHVESRFASEAAHALREFHACGAFRKYGTPSRSSVSSPRSSITPRSPRIRPVTRPPPARLTMAVWYGASFVNASGAK